LNHQRINILSDYRLSFSTTSSELSSEIPEKEEKDSRAAAKKDMIAPTNKHHATCNHKEKASGDGEAHRNVDSINGLAPNPDPREAAKEAARAGSRETPHEAPRAKDNGDSREARKERRHRDRRRSRHPHHATCNHKEKASGDGEAHRNVDSINGLAPNPDPREAAKEAARAGSRETPHEAPRAKDNGDSREARKERRHRDRRRSRHPPQAINTFWDQEDQDFIVRKNIQRNQRRIHAMQDRDETDDTLFEVPMRMPEVDFTNQTAVVA
ncbi:hypothetical protein COOONC_10698, partial [Cooperia oncophora]